MKVTEKKLVYDILDLSDVHLFYESNIIYDIFKSI